MNIAVTFESITDLQADAVYDMDANAAWLGAPLFAAVPSAACALAGHALYAIRRWRDRS